MADQLQSPLNLCSTDMKVFVEEAQVSNSLAFGRSSQGQCDPQMNF